MQVWKTTSFVSKILKRRQIDLNMALKPFPKEVFMLFQNCMLTMPMIVGDSAGFVTMPALKGMHLAIKSGMLAAQTAANALIKQRHFEKSLQQYETLVNNSMIYKDMYPVRNFRQGFAKGQLLEDFIWNSTDNQWSRFLWQAEISRRLFDYRKTE